MAKKTIRAWEPETIEIEPARRDGDGNIIEPAETIRVFVKRLTVDEATKFDRLFWRGVSNEAERLVLVRRPGEEQERQTMAAISSERLETLKNDLSTLESSPEAAFGVLRDLLAELAPTDQFIVPDEEIRRRRLLEMTDAERTRYELVRKQDAEAFGLFLSDALQHFVRVEAGQIEFIDDKEVTVDVLNGEQLAMCYGARPDILRNISMAIRAHNELTDAAKKDWRSRSASNSSSKERDPKATGGSSAPIAAPAVVSDSVMTEAATPIESRSSGQTAI